MRSRLTTLLTVIGAVTVLVLAGNTVALATTGKALIAGKTNTSAKPTAIKRTTPGVALKVITKSNANPPLAVNGTGKVANLNADKVDGLDSTVLRTRSYAFTAVISNAQNVTFTLPVPNGSYLVSYSNFFSGAVTSGIECIVKQDAVGIDDDRVSGYSSLVYTETSGWDPGLTGSGLATKSLGVQIRVSCAASDGTFSTEANVPMQIVATPTQLLSTTSVVPD